MDKKTKGNLLKGIRWCYIVFATFGILFFICVLSIPAVTDAFNKALPNISTTLNGMDVKTFLLASFGIGVLKDIWYFYLITRCVNEKSKGTLLLILLILGVVGGIVSIFVNKTAINIGVIVDAITLFALIRYRSASE